MKLNILVFSKKVAKGDESFDLSTLFYITKKTGFEIDNITFQNEYDFDLVERSINNEAVIIFCEKKDIEVYEINLSYKFSSEREVLFENCVYLKSGMNVLFVPIEKNYLSKTEDFLRMINSSNKTSIFRLFGKSANSVKKILNDNNINSKNIDVVENNLLCDVFLHEECNVFGVSEDQQKIGSLLMDNIYSESEMSLKDVVVEILKRSELKITFIEPFTCGEISRLFIEEKDQNVIYKSSIPINERALIGEAMMSGVDYKSFGKSSIETNNYLTNACLAEQGTDVVVVLTASRVDEGYCLLLTIASRQNRTTVKTVYKAEKPESVKFAVNWALFNLVKKLRKKDFENM